MKYLLVWDRMGQYHVARWRAAQARYGAANVLAADLGAADTLYGWETEWAGDPQYYRLSAKPVDAADFTARFSAFKKIVVQENIDVACIAGYGRKEYLAMAAWARWRGLKVMLFAESWYPTKTDFLKGVLIRRLADLFFVSGTRARAHFMHRLGVRAERIRTGYSVVDNDHFVTARGGEPGNVLLCVARFSPEKNLLKLIEAFAKSALPAHGWHLRLVGGGPQAETLEHLAKQHAWLELVPWQAYDKLPALYADARAFILPSTFEPWGLVVNEALAADLPVLASQAVGAVPDLLADAPAGIFNPHDETSMLAALHTCLTLPLPAPYPAGHPIHAHTPQTWAAQLQF